MMNSETWLPLIDAAICAGCGDCVHACPTNALGLVEGMAVLVDPDVCNYCAHCERICPVEAITLPYQIVLEGRI